MVNPAGVEYPYAEGDLLERRHDYFYSAFHGCAFLAAWRAARAAAVSSAMGSTCPPGARPATESPIARLLSELQEAFEHGDPSPAAWSLLDRLVHRFEVSKRVHGTYDSAFKPVDIEDYRDLSRYVAFAELLAQVAARAERLSYLSALLKCMDILCAYAERLPDGFAGRFARLVAAEDALVRAVQERAGEAAAC